MSRAPIRVLYLIDKLHLAGAQLHLASLVPRLDRSRFEARVVCLLREGAAADRLRADGVPVECLALGLLYGPGGWGGLRRLARLLRELRIDVIHTYLVSANLFGALAGRLAGVPAIVTSRRDTGFSRNWRLRLLEEWLVNPRVDRITAVSPSVAALTRRERGVPAERVVMIPNGVDVNAWQRDEGARFRLRRQWGLSEGDRAVGSVGHLSRVKGHDDLLRAGAILARRRPAARIVLVGDGPLRRELEELAKRLRIADRVVFTGLQADMPAVMSALDVLAVPSRTEGMSNALLEGMAAGLPPVATRTGGNGDVIRDGETGLLVAPRSPEALAEGLDRLLGDPSYASVLGARAREIVRADFPLELAVARHQQLYEELMAP